MEQNEIKHKTHTHAGRPLLLGLALLVACMLVVGLLIYKTFLFVEEVEEKVDEVQTELLEETEAIEEGLEAIEQFDELLSL